MVMRKWLVALVCLAGVLTGCKNDKVAVVKVSTEADSTAMAVEPERTLTEDELVEQQPMPTSAEKLFDDFFFNFASNRQLQLERIEFPLKVNSGYKVEFVEKSDWMMEHFFMHDDVYTLIFDNEEQMAYMKDMAVNEAIVERFYLDRDFVKQYLFHRDKGRWMLYELRNQTLPKNPNAPFVAFYQKFATDSDFQRSSLSSEIIYSGPTPNDDDAEETTVDGENMEEEGGSESLDGFITPDLWEYFAPELPQSRLYNIVYKYPETESKQKIMLIRGVANGFEEQLVFQLKGGKWKLTKLSR